MRIRPITPEDAAAIVAWDYPPPYDFYNGGEPGYLLDPANGFVALEHEGELAGFRSFGPDGRVPGGLYDDDALDTGGGLRPDLTGRGLGGRAIATGLEYGNATFAPEKWRITVAAFNARALTVVRGLGFEEESTFTAPFGTDFVILTRAAVR